MEMYYVSFNTNTITKKEVKGLTTTMVILVNNRKEAQVSQYGVWVPTWATGKAALVDYYAKRKAEKERSVEYETKRLAEVLAMQEPT